MSDEPKPIHQDHGKGYAHGVATGLPFTEPKPAQEWAEKAYAAIQDDEDMRPTLDILREHFNAAIAAERDKREQAEKEWVKLFHGKMDDNEQLRSQLADAKKNSTYQVLGEKVQEIGRLKHELSAVQAAIAKIDKIINGEEAMLNGKISGNLVARIRLAIKQAVGTTALDAATAEAQQPLVDALKQAREATFARGDAQVIRDKVRKVIDAALAKVKEGK